VDGNFTTVGETSPLRVLTSTKANRRRKLMLTPGFVNYPDSSTILAYTLWMTSGLSFRASGPRNLMKINNFSTRQPIMSAGIFDPARHPGVAAIRFSQPQLHTSDLLSDGCQ